MSPGRGPDFAHRAVILDRDGTIVVDRGYLSTPEGLELAPGAAEGLRRLQRVGYRLIIVTNQSGVGRGLLSLAQLRAINERLEHMIGAAGASIERTYFCPHRPDEDCACRKPRPGLVLQAAAELGFDPSAAIIVGDKSSDVQLGRNLGAFTVRIDSPEAGPAEECRERCAPDCSARDLLQAAEIITRLRPNAGCSHAAAP